MQVWVLKLLTWCLKHGLPYCFLLAQTQAPSPSSALMWLPRVTWFQDTTCKYCTQRSCGGDEYITVGDRHGSVTDVVSWVTSLLPRPLPQNSYCRLENGLGNWVQILGTVTSESHATITWSAYQNLIKTYVCGYNKRFWCFNNATFAHWQPKHFRAVRSYSSLFRVRHIAMTGTVLHTIIVFDDLIGHSWF